MKKKVALFGGAFDPPHNGHLWCISQLLNSGVVDEVLVIPSGDRPDKPEATPASHRYEMVRIALESELGADPRVALSDGQVSGAIGYGTIDVIDFMATSRPDADPVVVIGHELVKDLPAWKSAERLAAIASFLVIERPGASPATSDGKWRLGRFVPTEPGGIEVSSTLLRTMISKGLLCAGLFPSAVLSYCRANGLYP